MEYEIERNRKPGGKTQSFEQRLNAKIQEVEQLERLDSIAKSQTLRRYFASKTSDATKNEYTRKLRLMGNSKQLPAEYCAERNLSKRTYDTMKSAYLYWFANEINKLREQVKSGEQVKDRITVAENTLKSIQKWEYKQEKNQTQERRMRESGKISKRRTLRGLPNDWREQIQERLTNSKYRDAAQVLHLTGARPVEIKSGIRIKLDEEKGTISAYIRGAKCSDISNSGQSMRKIIYKRYSNEGQKLEKILERNARNDDEYTVKIESTSSFQKIYKAAAEKALGKPGKRITPYSARHQFSADMKAGGYSKTAIAAAMGHQSTRSQGQYGTANQGGGGGKMQVAAQQQIRNPDRTPSHQKTVSLRM
jgi:integrase